jgi:hypothetical protein
VKADNQISDETAGERNGRTKCKEKVEEKEYVI